MRGAFYFLHLSGGAEDGSAGAALTVQIWYTVVPYASIRTRMLFFKKPHTHLRHDRTPFTASFYRFLLGFVFILAVSIATLFFLGVYVTGGEMESPNLPPPSSQFAR